jgi:predicted AlkP superfamily phosphohydrolase/phosphomutase
MLALISFDAASLQVFDRMTAQGRLPNFSRLRERGKCYEMVSTPFHASVYRSLYTGVELSEHGAYYPLQWDAREQCVKPAPPVSPKELVFTRLDRAGKNVLVIDPPECVPFSLNTGLAMSGWQIRTRFVLPEWCSSSTHARELKDKFGPPQNCHEVFGKPSIPRLMAMRDILYASPQRLVQATLSSLQEGDFDLVWVTFAAAHIAGHQLWRESLEGSPEPMGWDGVPAELAGLLEKVDEALGQILEALPKDADVIVFSPNGMGPETARVDLLPEMLSRILNGEQTDAVTSLPSNRLWRLRATVPTEFRARIADALPDWVAAKIAAKGEALGVDWSKTRAFALPSDGAGFVRLNLKGRERDGIVDLREAGALLDQIAEALRTFVEPDGRPTVEAVVRSSQLIEPGPKSDLLPDLVVLWSHYPAAGLERVTSPKYGEIVRNGIGTGRSGNHCPGTWAVVSLGESRNRTLIDGSIRAVDLPATVCATLGVPYDDLPGRSLFL